MILSTYCNVLWLHHIHHQEDNSPAYRLDQWFLTGGDFAPHLGNIWQRLKTILHNCGACSWHLVGPEARGASNIQQCTGPPPHRKALRPQMSAVSRLRNRHVSRLSTTQRVHSGGRGATHPTAPRFPFSSQQQSPFSCPVTQGKLSLPSKSSINMCRMNRGKDGREACSKSSTDYTEQWLLGLKIPLHLGDIAVSDYTGPHR